MRIENYLGFPTGLTGAELTDRATLQANKFGAHLSIPTAATRLSFENGYSSLDAGGDEPVTAKCLLIATGAQYRRLDIEGVERFEGTGLYYAASTAEALLCRGCPVIVVGGGNSAGQAAVFLAGHASRVLLLIRGDNLNKHMSSYLVRRIEQTANIELLCNTVIRQMVGNGHLKSVEIADNKTGRQRVIETPAVLVSLGRHPEPIGCLQTLSVTQEDSSGRERPSHNPDLGTSHGRHSSWRPAVRVSSPRETCAPVP
jgi:thioredoxin reductase (NADPH)